jgi:hypothetical protein
MEVQYPCSNPVGVTYESTGEGVPAFRPWESEDLAACEERI